MKSRPIIFNAEMVRAILDGRKTQTRRVLRPQPITPEGHAVIKKDKLIVYERAGDRIGEINATLSFPMLYGKEGDFLWVRESIIRRRYDKEWFDGATYKADLTAVLGKGPAGAYCGRAVLDWKWKRDTLPSIFMPRWASRISLRIVDVKAERIQDISSLDIAKEGVEPDWTGMARDFDQEKWGYLDLSAVSPEDVIIHYENLYENFIELWDSINAKRGYPWSSNSWIWVIEFERVEDE